MTHVILIKIVCIQSDHYGSYHLSYFPKIYEVAMILEKQTHIYEITAKCKFHFP